MLFQKMSTFTPIVITNDLTAEIIKAFDEENTIDNHLNMHNFRIYNLGDPQDGKDAVHKYYVDHKTYSLSSPNIIGNLDYSRIDNKPTSFPTRWDDIADKPSTFPSESVDWNNITNKPTNFPTTNLNMTVVDEFNFNNKGFRNLTAAGYDLKYSMAIVPGWNNGYMNAGFRGSSGASLILDNIFRVYASASNTLGVFISNGGRLTTIETDGIGTSCSLSVKENIRDKSSLYIFNAEEPTKNYWNKIAGFNSVKNKPNLPVYTYTYKPIQGFETSTKIYHSFGWEDCYEIFNNVCSQGQNIIECCQKPMEYYDNSNEDRARTITMQRVIPYIVLGLQEFNKFEYTPLKQEVLTLKNKVNELEATVEELQQQIVMQNNVITGLLDRVRALEEAHM